MVGRGDDLTTVLLTESEVNDAHRLAEQSLARYATRKGYYRNTSNSHLLGRLGEMACHKWLSNQTAVQPIYKDPDRDRECDLHVGNQRIEVKTWNATYWASWGRCVAVGQMDALQAKADLIVWTTVESVTAKAASIQIRGWNTIQDILVLTPIWTGPTGKKVNNYQVPQSKVRPLSTLTFDGTPDALLR